MTSPLGALLAGLGRASSIAGESMDARAAMAEQRQRQEAQDRRQLAIDELLRREKLQAMGAVADTGMPTAADMADTYTPGNLLSGGGPIAALARGAEKSAGAERFTLPSLRTGADESYRIDDTRTPSALALQQIVARQRGQNMDPNDPSVKDAANKEWDRRHKQEVKDRSPDPMARFFEGQRNLQDRQDADRWQTLYLKYLGNPSDPNSEAMSPADAAAAADEAFGGHPRMAPNINKQPPQPPMGTTFTPGNP